MRIIKLTLFPVIFRFRFGSYKLLILLLLLHVLRYLRTLHIVWSLTRRRDARRLTRLQTMCNVLKYCKIFKTFQSGCGYFFNLLKTSTVASIIPGPITEYLIILYFSDISIVRSGLCSNIYKVVSMTKSFIITENSSKKILQYWIKVNERKESMQETQHTQPTATRTAQNQYKETTWM